ncbi:MAG: hypothetical protein ACXAEU_02230 [Candidatus Hodarchaeales archaeon]
MSNEEQEKLISQIMKDMKLLTDTARIMHQKMESVQNNTIRLLGSLGITIGEAPTTKAIPTPVKATPAPMTKSRGTNDFKTQVTSESVSEILSSFSSFVQKATNPAEVADRLDRMRDKIIPLYSGGFHPAFAEMGRTAREVKGMKTINEAKKMLQEKIIDWRSRLVK